jgi:1-phosphofructokinase
VIVTVTANPSLDRTIEVDALRRGDVLRARASRLDAGGKGVNVARALAANGHKATAVLPCGGAEGSQLTALLAESGLDLVAVPIDGTVRSNVTVVELDGTTTKLNEPGPSLTTAELLALAEAACLAAEHADWVVVSGSLPPGAPADAYARLLARLQQESTRIALDTSGDALRAALPGRPYLIKPNREELAEVTGRTVRTLDETLEATEVLRAQGIHAVLTSLGKDGAVLVDGDGCWHASAPAVEPRSTVGAGDALLAGFLAAGGRGPLALAEAVAWGSAATALPGSRMPGPTDIDRRGVIVSDLAAGSPDHLDLTRPLADLPLHAVPIQPEQS